MSRVLLIRPPFVFSRSSFSTAATMPLATAYLSANLIAHGHEVSNIDALGEAIDHFGDSYSPELLYRGMSIPAIVDRIGAHKPDGIGLTVMFSQSWPHVEDLINAIRRKYRDMPILVGGEHATAASGHILESCPAATHVALGEGEETVVDWADWLDGKKRAEEIAGLRRRGADGGVLAAVERARVREPDLLPRPAWNLFDLEPYFAVGEGHGTEQGRTMPLLATRGCPYQCTFCSSPSMWTTRYVMRSVGLVVDEIETYLKDYRASNIDFCDLTAVIRKGWIIDFCREIKRRRLKFSWQLPSGTRSEAMDEEVLGEMASAGCLYVAYAPESGSQSTLGDIKKLVRLPRMLESIRSAKKHGIAVKCNLIIGFPREKRRNILETLGLIPRLAWLGVDDTSVYPFRPYPGSELYEYLRGTGAIKGLGRSYFESLTYTDFFKSGEYCENIGPREISFYRFLGLGLFYLLSYLFQPSRIARSLRNFFNRRSDTTFELRLFALLRRQSPEKSSPSAVPDEIAPS